MEKKITLPLTEKVIKSLKVGDKVLLSGTIFTARDAAHKRFLEDKKNNKNKKDNKKKENKKDKNKNNSKQNKNSKDKVKLKPYLLLVKESILKVLGKINKFIPIAYFIFDGAFGNNPAVQMIKQCGLDIISKLQKNSALCFPNEEGYSGKGAPKKYGDDIGMSPNHITLSKKNKN